MGLDGEAGVVKDREPVHDVGAQLGVNFLCPVLAEARPVPRPVGEVAHNLKREQLRTASFIFILLVPCSLLTIPEALLDNSQ